MTRSTVVAVMTLAIALSSCGSGAAEMGAAAVEDETDLTTETTNQTHEEEETLTKDPPTHGASLESVCDTFNKIISDFTMNDETTAAELNTLASSAGSHPQLENAIRDIADAFAAHDEEILSTPVTEICG